MLNTTSFAPILVNSALLPNNLRLNQITTGRADILPSLMPHLALASGVKPAHYLAQTDEYMVLETRQLLNRLAKVMQSDELPAMSAFYLELNNNRLCIKSPAGEIPTLSVKANQDPWCIGAFSWLHANYVALVHSVELRHFAALYQRNKSQALLHYRHFDEPNNGLLCRLMYQAEVLTLCWESPLELFYPIK